MTVDDVKRIFGVLDVIELPGGAQVSAETFANMFADASNNPTYEELISIDGGTKGYKPFFDQCKAEGILN